MARIAVRTEETLVNQDSFALKLYSKTDMTEAIGQSVGHTTRNLGIQTIVAATESGHTARMISKYRPKHISLQLRSQNKKHVACHYHGVFTQQLLTNHQAQMKCLI